MGFFSSVRRQIERDVSNVSGATGGSNFNVVRAVAGDPTAFANTANRGAHGESPRDIVREQDAQMRRFGERVGAGGQSLFDEVRNIGATHQDWWDKIRQGTDATGREIKKAWDKLGNTIEHTVDKWGGEQRVMGWVIVGVVVIIYVLVVVFSWGSLTAPATAGLVSVLAAVGGYGLSAGLGMYEKQEIGPQLASIYNTDDSVYTSIDSNGGSGSQSGSGLAGMMAGARNLPPVALAGLAVVGAIGVWFLLKR